MSPFLRFLIAKKLDGRIISYNCFPYDLVKADERVLPEAGILRIISVITQHKIAIIRNCIWTEASLHFLWNKGIIKSSLRTVDVYLSVLDLNSLSRKSDHTFDEKLAFIIRIFENYNVKALGILDFFGNLMSKQIQIDTICKTESKDTVAGHNSFLHGRRRDFCVDQYYIVDNQDYLLSGFFETDKAKEP